MSQFQGSSWRLIVEAYLWTYFHLITTTYPVQGINMPLFGGILNFWLWFTLFIFMHYLFIVMKKLLNSQMEKGMGYLPRLRPQLDPRYVSRYSSYSKICRYHVSLPPLLLIRINAHQGRIQKISKGGAISKRARQPNLPPLKKKNTPDLGYYFFKRAVFSILKIWIIFFKVYRENQRGPTTFVVFFLAPEDMKRPWEARKTCSTGPNGPSPLTMLVGNRPQKRIVVWNKENLETLNTFFIWMLI